jgi:hypothetical protein
MDARMLTDWSGHCRVALQVVLLLPEPQGAEKLRESVPDTAVAELNVPEMVPVIGDP